MEVGSWLLYPSLLALSAVLTYLTSRDAVSPVAAVLAAYYASVGDTALAMASAATIVAYSLVRLALARPTGSRAVAAVKLRYSGLVALLVLSSVPVAYVAYGASLTLLAVESWPLTVLILVSVYLLVGTAVAPGTAAIYSRRVWQGLSLDSLEDWLMKLGTLLGGVLMLVNSVLHGLLGLLPAFPYAVAVVLAGRLRPPLRGIAISAVVAVSAAVTYLVGYA